ENAPPYDVLLGQFGRRALLRFVPYPPGIFPTDPRPGAAYFPETRHNLGGRFLDYWLANGGLAQFGYPLTEESLLGLEDGRTYTVQYFERARLELHPENAPPYDVLLGQFGRQILAEVELLQGEPAFFVLYTANGAVRQALRAPTGEVVR